jgi:hypothetical protein
MGSWRAIMSRITRPSWYDFQRVSKNDLESEQSSYLDSIATSTRAALGTGVKLTSPQEPVIFDSDDLTATQQGYVAVNTFDGRGVLETPYLTTDQIEGNQIAVTIADARLNGYLSTIVTIIGKTFDDQLVYEHIELTNNGTEVSTNHFKEITNIMFQNFRGNSNTSVDGYGSKDVGGTLQVTECSSFRVSRDLIVDQQIIEPDMIFRLYKVYDSGKTLQVVLQEALGTSNDVDDLDVNTTTASTRVFSQGATTDVIVGQKFKMSGNNIQKVSLLLSVESIGTWSGTLVIGIRPLQTSESCSTEFLPDNEIGFDPDTVPLEEVAISATDISNLGIVLTTEPQVVDFVFTSSNISNPSLSKLEDGKYYVLTVRRTGSTAINSIVMQEARNDNSDRMLTVFNSSVWTDVPDSTMWYRIWSDSIKVASGSAYDQGYRITVEKTEINNDGARVQKLQDNINLTNTSEDAENYLVTQRTIEFINPETHPRTGDEVFSTAQDAPLFSVLSQTDTQTLLESQSDLLVLARIRDTNSRSNPTITGTIDYPALARGNVIHIINPGSDLLNQNVIGSIITPNTNKPTLRYRIISQEIFDDLYGDVNGDGIINLDDVARMAELDGYGRDLSTGSVLAATQLAAIQNESVSILEILRSDVDANGTITSASDLNQLNQHLTDGTAFTGGSGFTRVTLEVEPITSPHLMLNDDAESTLQIEVEDPDLIDNISFVALNFQIDFVPVWMPENVEIIDLRRFSCTAFTDFNASDLTSTPESGGKNNYFIPGDLYLNGNVKNLDGTYHKLDFEKAVVELELPAGDTEGEINVFDTFVLNKMKFSDGTLVSASAITNNQVVFEVAIGSHVKNVLDGYDYDGYVDFTGTGADADEVIGTYIDHNSGLLRINAYNIVRNEFYPQIRTRILITVSLKKAGFTNNPVYVSATELSSLLS